MIGTADPSALRAAIRRLSDAEIRQALARADERAGTADAVSLDAILWAAAAYFIFLPRAAGGPLDPGAEAVAFACLVAGLPAGRLRPLAEIVGPDRPRPHVVLSDAAVLRRVEDQIRARLRAGYRAAEDWSRSEKVALHPARRRRKWRDGGDNQPSP